MNLDDAQKELLKWHDRLGHVSFRRVQFLMRMGILAKSEATRRLHAKACKLTYIPMCAACRRWVRWPFVKITGRLLWCGWESFYISHTVNYFYGTTIKFRPVLSQIGSLELLNFLYFLKLLLKVSYFRKHEITFDEKLYPPKKRTNGVWLLCNNSSSQKKQICLFLFWRIYGLTICFRN